jgi:hypothetical protein
MTDGIDVDQFLESGIDMFEREVKERYESREDAKVVWKLAERVAQLIHEDVQLLAVKKKPVWNEIRRA